MGHIAETEIQLLYADTDMMGVMYHGNYIKWLELGRIKLIEDLGFSYVDMEREGFVAPIHNVNITYKVPIMYGDRAFVRTWVTKNTGIRVTYAFEIVNQDGDVCADGDVTCIVGKRTETGFKPVNFKKAYPEWFAKYEEIKFEE